MIHEIAAAVHQVVSFIEDGALISKTGKKIPTRIHTFCAHGDEASGVDVLLAVRRALEQKGIRLAPLPEIEF
jgi:UPF0271 protein